jgi:hypothetical protein
VHSRLPAGSAEIEQPIDVPYESDSLNFCKQHAEPNCIFRSGSVGIQWHALNAGSSGQKRCFSVVLVFFGSEAAFVGSKWYSWMR